jgi:hypothetical protein
VTIQSVVLGSRALRTGIRKSPVFVGAPTMHGATVVHYIAPPEGEVAEMMQALRAFERRTRGGPSLLRAGALSFGFIYIHPLADGNGRMHRLLVNDTLMRDGQVPTGVVVPISSTIIGSSRQRGDYERVLERFSAPFIRRYATAYRFTNEQRVCEDGVATDFQFDAEADALHAWRFPDLTDHVLYMSRVVRDTVLHGMTDEATFLARHDEARRRLKAVCEMPDLDADAIVRSLRENNGRVSNKLRERYPTLFDDGALQLRILDAVGSGLTLQFGNEDEDVDDGPAPTEHPRG